MLARATLVPLVLLLAGCAAPDEAVAPLAVTANACAKLDVVPARDTLRALEEDLAVNVTLTNCGDDPLVVRPGGMCFRDTALGIHIGNASDAYYWHAGVEVPFDLSFWDVSQGACIQFRDEAPVRLSLAAGESHTDTLRWNGTLHKRAWCAAGEGERMCTETVVAQPGMYVLAARYHLDGEPPVRGTTSPVVENSAMLLVTEPAR